MRYLLDSVILIDHFNGIEAATDFLDANADECSVSVITRAETLAGFDADSEHMARELLDSFATLPVTVEVADTAARLRRSQRWRLPDAIQAAIALQEELTLVTRNTKDFKDGDPIPVLTPYVLTTTDNPIISTDNPLSEAQRLVLGLVLNLIVPASKDGRRPSAAEVDVLGYIREVESHTLGALRTDLDRLDAEARSTHGEAFASLDPATRQRLVDALREREPHFLRTLAMQTVTCYYQDDRVVEAIGVGARPPFPEGYEVPSGDLSLLEPVRQRGKIYRDA